MPTLGPVVRLTGSGEGGSGEFRLTPGLVFFMIKHPTDTPFAVYLMNDKGDHLALLANSTRAVAGSRAYGVEHEGAYYLHLIANDDWEIEVVQPPTVATVGGSTPESFEGLGPAATMPVALKAGTIRITWQHSGVTPFTLLVLDAAGRRVATVAESSTAKSGAGDASIPADGVYLLDVGADGGWTVMLPR